MLTPISEGTCEKFGTRGLGEDGYPGGCILVRCNVRNGLGNNCGMNFMDNDMGIYTFSCMNYGFVL
jgi:hypothetical protein